MFQAEFFATAVLVLASSPSAHAQPAFFMGLGDLPGGAFSSTVRDISADGSVVVGSSNSARGIEGFRWTRETGMVSIGAAGIYGNGVYMRISADGSTIIGTIGSTSYDLQPFRWKKETGVEYLPLQDNYGVLTAAVSGDGAIVILNLDDLRPATTTDSLTGRWTHQGGFEVLFHGGASDVTPDGLVILASGPFPANQRFLWSAQHGASYLGSLPGAISPPRPLSISDDGKVAVGSFEISEGIGRAARWTQETGWVQIGAVQSTVSGVSADGSIITGRAYEGADRGALIWDAIHGSRNVRQLLINEYGLGENVAGWNLESASRVSADGRTVTGWGVNPAGNSEGWIAYLGTPVPEPSTLALAALALAPFARRRRSVPQDA